MGKTLLNKGFIVCLLVFTLMFTNFAFAKGYEESESEVLELSLKDAIQIAEENNLQIKLSKTGLEKAELGRRQYRYQDRKLQDAIDMWGIMDKDAMKEEMIEDAQKEIKEGLKKKYGDDWEKYWDDNMGVEEAEKAFYELSREMEGLTSFETSSTTDLMEKRVEVGVRLAKAGIDVAVKGVRFGVEAAYYGVLSAKENTEIARKSLDRQGDMLRIAEVKYEVGSVAKTEVLDAHVQFAKAEVDLLKAKSEEEKAYINLKKLLGLPLDKDLQLTDSFEYEPSELDITLEELIARAQRNRIDIMSAEGAFEIAKLDFDLSSKVYPSNTFIYKEKEYAMEEAYIKFTDTKSDVESEVRGVWLSFKEASANIPVMDKAVEMAKESLRLAKLSYEAGLVRRVDVAAAEEGLKQVQLQRSGVIYNYNLARLKLDNVAYLAVPGSVPSGAQGAMAGI